MIDKVIFASGSVGGMGLVLFCLVFLGRAIDAIDRLSSLLFMLLVGTFLVVNAMPLGVAKAVDSLAGYWSESLLKPVKLLAVGFVAAIPAAVLGPLILMSAMSLLINVANLGGATAIMISIIIAGLTFDCLYVLSVRLSCRLITK